MHSHRHTILGPSHACPKPHFQKFEIQSFFEIFGAPLFIFLFLFEFLQHLCGKYQCSNAPVEHPRTKILEQALRWRKNLVEEEKFQAVVAANTLLDKLKPYFFQRNILLFSPSVHQLCIGPSPHTGSSEIQSLFW
jgi:hypothetical protein